MDREQGRLFELLKEFDTFCKENEIMYCLSGATLLYGFCYGEMEPRPCYASVVMNARNCKKFIDSFNAAKPLNREIEYWGNSKDYPDYTLRYVASDTTAFNLLDFNKYQTHGMCIEIQILRSEITKKAGRHIRVLERGIVLSNKDPLLRLSKIKRKKDIACAMYYKFFRLICGKSGIRTTVFKYISANCDKPKSQGKGLGGLYQFSNDGKAIKDVSEYCFEHPETCSIEGYEFSIPSNTRALLWKMYPNRYSYTGNKDLVSSNYRYAESSIVDIDAPYTESICNIGINKQEIEELTENKRRIEELYRLNAGNNKIAREDWQTVLQTDARFRMWKEFEPKKKEILKLYEDGDFAQLNIVLEPYAKELRAMKPQNRSFSFDNDILKIYINLLEISGDFEEANRVYTRLPKSHFEEIQL